jgi:curved DNA-binding protein CbpA
MPEQAQVADYYEVLGVSETATDSEIRAAYIELVKLAHPDRLGTTPDAAEWKTANAQLAVLNEAFHTLGDPARRRQYDAGRSSGDVASPGHAPPPPERLYIVVTGSSMPDRNKVIDALLKEHVISSYHSYINHCIFCTSRKTATDISNSLVKHFGKSGQAVFFVAEACGEMKGRMSMGAWEYIRKNTFAGERGWA